MIVKIIMLTLVWYLALFLLSQQGALALASAPSDGSRGSSGLLANPSAHSLKNITNFTDKPSQRIHSLHENKSSLPSRDQRFLSLFTVVRFANSECVVNGNSGTCYTASECRREGGTEIGTCARGFGVCCYKEITCGGSSSTNCTYLVSPNYPGTYNEARSCTMSITRKPDTCQLRLDFVEFESIAPDGFGVCNDDQFTVAGERKFTFLCGSAPASWHFYLDVNGKANPTEMSFLTSTLGGNRKFKIKVSMIECQKKVPCGCGQYYTGNTGSFQSFNYGGSYLAGVDYGICFRKEKNKCTTTLTTQGPSFVSCPFDLYRLPVGQTAGTSIFVALNVQAMYCQLNAAPNALFTSLVAVQSPLTTVSNGPLTIWHATLIDALQNFHSNANCPTCAGFSKDYTHNDC
ncbi:uncharacterized protein LOC122247428 [Penaeus japonicus]|uniref:uncharacterized protein LOC122247428 n=1 Tax=Penaeus japonicus TaxID=27405 RepID=UPI001C7113C9|nr:uncharacterized protein LOC122247428 [Penaeus japonicus]